MIIQRAVEDEFDAWLGRARYERRPDYQRGLRNYESGLRNGYRPRRVQTAEGELEVEIPQVREAAEPFVSALFPHSTKLLRTRPLEAMVVGAFVRGLSMRDVESLCEEAGLGKLSKSTASRICAELRERFEAFRRRDLHEIGLVALFLDLPRSRPPAGGHAGHPNRHLSAAEDEGRGERGNGPASGAGAEPWAGRDWTAQAPGVFRKESAGGAI